MLWTRSGAGSQRRARRRSLSRAEARFSAEATRTWTTCSWDGDELHLVDFEDAGLSCLSYDLADLIEHVSARGTPDQMWLAFADAHRDGCDDLFHASRRAMAGWWLLALLPGGVGHHRNPAGSDVRQAERLLRLLETA